MNKSSENLTNLEAYVEYISRSEFLKKGDTKLFDSIVSQIKKQLGLTDRQVTLMQKKVREYKELLTSQGYFHYEDHIKVTAFPIREIDRSKKITVETMTQEYDEPTTWVAIKFPFSNRMIKHIDFIKKIKGSEYYMAEKTHYVPFTEQNVYTVVNRFRDLGFEIQDTVLEFYDKVAEFANNPDMYKPGIYNYELRNVSDVCKKYCYERFGEPDKHNIHLYLDNADELGLVHFDYPQLQAYIEKRHSNVLYRFLSRTNKNVHVPSADYSLNEVIDCIHKLERLPLLIVMPHGNHTQDPIMTTGPVTEKKEIHECDSLAFLHQMIRQILPNSFDMSVLYRKDNNLLWDKEFNNYITREQLNSPVTKDTKVVVVSNTKKIPKPLVGAGWLPKAILFLGESLFVNRSVSTYKESSGLNIFYSKQLLYNNTGFCRL